MCGRFVNLNKIDKLNKIFEINESENVENGISYNIAPSQSTIIITNSKFFKIEKADWGMKFFDKRQNQEKNIINSRLETIQNKILFKESFEKRRCVIPANGYYEWSINDNIKIPYFINIPDKETIYFAGIWKYLNFKKSSMKVFSIITKPSNSLLKEIHDRMPVTLSSEESKDVMLSSVQGEIRFDKYDPLGMIPSENTIDWDEPDCSIDCELNLKQLE